MKTQHSQKKPTALFILGSVSYSIWYDSSCGWSPVKAAPYGRVQHGDCHQGWLFWVTKFTLCLRSSLVRGEGQKGRDVRVGKVRNRGCCVSPVTLWEAILWVFRRGQIHRLWHQGL